MPGESARALSEHRELAIVNRVATAVSQSLDLDKVLDVALTEVMKALDVPSGGIYLLDEETGQLVLRIHRRFTDPFLEEKSVVGLGEGCAGTAAESGEIFSAFGRADAVYVCEDAERLMGLDCLCAAPLIAQGQVIGVLELFASVARRLTEHEAELLSLIDNQIAIAIQNAKIFGREQDAKGKLKQTLYNMNLLLEVTRRITTTLDTDTIVNGLVELISRSLRVGRVTIGFYHPETDDVVLAAGFGDAAPESRRLRVADTGPTLRRAFTHGETVFLEDSEREAPRLADVWRQFNVRSRLIVPLVLGDRVIGTIGLDEPGRKRRFSDEEIDVLKSIARQAAVAVENARAYLRQQSIASTLQESFLPGTLPNVAGLEFGANYRSAEAMVGGDFYDFVLLTGNRVAVVIGDVSGKGVDATALASVARNAVRALAYQDPSPDKVLARTNTAVCQQVEPGQFITLSYALFDCDTGRLSYSTAGHPPAFWLRPDRQKPRLLSATRETLPLGIETAERFAGNTIASEIGDCFVFYTDGVTEARRDHELFGQHRLENLLRGRSDLLAQELADTILRAANDFSGGRLSDDLAIVVVRRTQ